MTGVQTCALPISEAALFAVTDALKAEGIVPRRYFYPSLNTLDFVQRAQPETQQCPVSEDIALRVLSLPLHPALPEADVARICAIVNSNV